MILKSELFGFLQFQLKKVTAELGELSRNPQGLLLEAIHSAAYSGALANPLIAPESAINRLNETILEEFVAVSQINYPVVLPQFLLKI